MNRREANERATRAAETSRRAATSARAAVASCAEVLAWAEVIAEDIAERIQVPAFDALPAMRKPFDVAVERGAAEAGVCRASWSRAAEALRTAQGAVLTAERSEQTLTTTRLLGWRGQRRLVDDAVRAASAAEQSARRATAALEAARLAASRLTDIEAKLDTALHSAIEQAEALNRRAARLRGEADAAAAAAASAADQASAWSAEADRSALYVESHPGVSDTSVALANEVRELASATSTAARDARRSAQRAARAAALASRSHRRLGSVSELHALDVALERLERAARTAIAGREAALGATHAAERSAADARRAVEGSSPVPSLIPDVGTPPHRPPAEPGWRSLRLPPAEVVIAVIATGMLLASVATPAVGIGFMVLAIVTVVARALSTFAGLIGAYVCVLFLIPSRFTLQPYAISAAGAISLLLALLWLSGRARPDAVATGDGSDHRRLLRLGPVALAVLAFFLAMVLSYAVGHLQPLSKGVLKASDRHLLLLFGLVAVAVACADGLRTRHQLYRVLGVVVTVAATTAAIGVLQFVTGSDLVSGFRPPGFTSEQAVTFIYERAGFRRVAGTARNPIEMGIVWAATLPLALHLAGHARSRTARRAALVAAGLLVVALPMALSRSAIVAMVLGLAIVLPAWSPQRRFRMVTGGAVAFAAVIIAFAPLVGALGEVLRGEEGAASLRTRDRVREEAFEIAGDSLWFGKGFGSYTPGETSCKGAVPSDTGCVIDNLYAVMLIEIGYVGIAAFLTTFAIGVGAARRVRRRSPRAARGDLAQSLVAGIVAVLVAGWGLNHLRYPLVGGLLFLYLGLIGALHRQAEEDQRADLAGGTGSTAVGELVP